MIEEITKYKTKYPEYANIDDLTLATKLATDHPECKDWPDKVKKEQKPEWSLSDAYKNSASSDNEYKQGIGSMLGNQITAGQVGKSVADTFKTKPQIAPDESETVKKMKAIINQTGKPDEDFIKAVYKNIDDIDNTKIPEGIKKSKFGVLQYLKADDKEKRRLLLKAAVDKDWDIPDSLKKEPDKNMVRQSLLKSEYQEGVESNLSEDPIFQAVMGFGFGKGISGIKGIKGVIEGGKESLNWATMGIKDTAKLGVDLLRGGAKLAKSGVDIAKFGQEPSLQKGLGIKFREKIDSDWARIESLEKNAAIAGLQQTGEILPTEARTLYFKAKSDDLIKAKEFIEEANTDLLKTTKKVGLSESALRKDVYDYMLSQHAPEANRVLASKGTNIGQTTESAIENVKRIEALPHAEEVKRISKKLQDYDKSTLDLLYADGKPWGVLTKDEYDKFRKYQFHVSTYRVQEGDDIKQVFSGTGLDVKGSGIRGRTGSQKEVNDLMENIYTARAQAVQRVQKNIVDNVTYNYVKDYIKAFPEQKLFEIVKPSAIGKTFDGEPITRFKEDPRSLLQFEYHGDAMGIKINDSTIAGALKGVNREAVGGFIGAIGKGTRLMASLATTYNPEFAASNKLRDLQDKAVYLMSTLGIKSAAKSNKTVLTSHMDIINSIRGVDTEGAKLYNRLKELGGAGGGIALSTKEQLAKSFDSILAEGRSPGRKGLAKVFDGFENWNKIFEDSTRLDAFKEALKSGMSEKQAALIAKRSTIDFDRMGTWGPVINSLYMFSNASIQATSKTLRALKNPKVAAATTATIGAAGFAADSWNDKVDPSWENKVSTYDKANSLNLVLPTKEFRYISIPIAISLKPIKIAMDCLSSQIRGKDFSASDAARNIVSSVLEGANPLGGSDIQKSIFPTFTRPAADLASNTDFKGMKIRNEWNEYAPKSTQYFKSTKDAQTGKIAIAATKALADSAKIEISPEDILYSLQSYASGPGRFAGKMFNAISAMVKGEKVETRDIPFVSRFVRKPDLSRMNNNKEVEKVKEALTEDKRKEFYRKEALSDFHEQNKTLPAEEAKERVEAVGAQKKISKMIKQEINPYSSIDYKLKDMSPEGRAGEIYRMMIALPPEKRTDFIRDKEKKELLKGETIRYFNKLLKQE